MPDSVIFRDRDGTLRMYSRIVLDRSAWVLDWDHKDGPRPGLIDEITDNGPPSVEIKPMGELENDCDTVTQLAPGTTIEVPSNDALTLAETLMRGGENETKLSPKERLQFTAVQEFLTGLMQAREDDEAIAKRRAERREDERSQ